MFEAFLLDFLRHIFYHMSHLRVEVRLSQRSGMFRLGFQEQAPPSCRIDLIFRSLTNFPVSSIAQSGDPYEAVCSGCQTSCDECSFEEPDLAPICEDVVDHSISSGGTVTLEALLIQPGYWRATASSTVVLACYNAEACLGGVSETADFCLEGLRGTL